MSDKITYKNTFSREEQQEYDYSVHLDELLKEITCYNIKDGYEKFEELSMYIKKKISKLSINYKVEPKVIKSVIDMTEPEKKIVNQIENKKFKKLNKIPNQIDDVLEKAKILEWAGINFGRKKWYLLKLAMNKLLLSENALTMKFWGKIFGSDSDYYIVYGKLKSYPFQKYTKNPYFEPKGQEGVNQYSFYVSNTYLEDWYQLPDISPQQLRESMLFKYQFTGNLKAKVNSFTSFSGSEAHLLKCQILRIMHACFVVPDNYLETKAIENSEEVYGIDLTDKVTQVKEDFIFPTSNEELMNGDKWVHEFSYIWPSGKTLEVDGENTAISRLRPVSQDTRNYFFNNSFFRN